MIIIDACAEIAAKINIATNTESLQELNDLRKEVEQLRAYKSKKEAETNGYIANIADWDEKFALHLDKQYNPPIKIIAVKI